MSVLQLCIVFHMLESHSIIAGSGATLEELDEAEAALKCKFPAAARLLFRLCNGQRIPESKDVDDEHRGEAHYVGLIGGYNFSHHFVNVHLLSLRQAR
jgi:hypothetical protein